MQRFQYSSTGQKVAHFVVGFFGWFLLNAVAWGLLGVLSGAGSSLFDDLLRGAGVTPGLASDIVGAVYLGLSCLVMLLNIGTIIYFAFTRYWIALGELAAFGLVLVLTLCAALLFGAACFAILAGMSGGF
jgi:hypothetical protein